ncbi:MAG: hypothetical protein Ct9H300mP22_3170 [Gammaproteobacteria bacterium]|nr:MAG: hypothetical protein Ct9H300mP22_3170 [Gammaproteobacteria bacterium]
MFAINLKNLSPQIIVEHLQKILDKESVEYDKESLWQIANAASGSMRDALTLVDQGVSYCQGSIEAAGIIEMLGVPEQQQVFCFAGSDVPKECRRTHWNNKSNL